MFNSDLSHILNNSDDKLNDRLNDKLNSLTTSTYLFIKQHPGIRRKELATKTQKSIPTIDRILIELQKHNLIEHKGSKKTGGYYAK